MGAGPYCADSAKVCLKIGASYMPVSPELLAILVCPVCKTRIYQLPDGTGLKCDQCKRIYPIRDDIPVMLPEEATLAKD
jgi:uncharacterized protein